MAKSPRSALLLLLSISLLLQPALGVITLQELFPFGTAEGDSLVPAADDNFVQVNLLNGQSFAFFNNSYTSLFVNNNGGVSFQAGVPQYTPTCGPLTSPMIIPYWADIDTRKGGQVFYRETNDPNLLAMATTEVENAFPNIQNLDINWLFIVTWSEGAFFGSAPPAPGCGGTDLRNTFQLVLLKDGNSAGSAASSISFVIFNYNQITWTTGTASNGDCNGQGGTPAKAGFDVGDGQTFFSIEGSCTADISNITSTSNVNRPGQWIFRVDGALVEPDPVPEPTSSTMAPGPPQCTADTCLHTGHCFTYSLCDVTRSEWVSHNCSEGLFWNPHHTGNQTLSECYGSCDVWENLSPETQAAYKADPTCFPESCFYEQVEECGSEYNYYSNDSDHRQGPAARLRCPVDSRQGMNVSLVWVQDRETCDFCYNAIDHSTGQPCCQQYEAHIPTSTVPGVTSSTTTMATTSTDSSNTTSTSTMATTSTDSTNSTSSSTATTSTESPIQTVDPTASTTEMTGPPASEIPIVISPGTAPPASRNSHIQVVHPQANDTIHYPAKPSN